MDELLKRYNEYQYYILAGVISIVALAFLPMLGSAAGIEWNLPNTVPGWIVFVTTRILIAAINMLVFHCFVQQGKTNISSNETYKTAFKKYIKQESEVKKPRSPQEYHRQVYGKKGIAVFIASLLSAVALTQAVLTFDWIQMLTYLFTILGGILCGILQMKESERFWIEEFPMFVEEFLNKEGEEIND